MQTKALSIQGFLLSYVLGDGEDDVRGAHLRAEVERHRLRTTTVRPGDAAEAVVRCSACPVDESWPCLALRALAAPYSRHPAYRPEWHLDRPDADAVPRPRSSA